MAGESLDAGVDASRTDTKAEMIEPTIYVVDDDETVRAALTRTLESAAYSTRGFASAEAFLNAFRPDTHGCLLLDVQMPGMSGLDLLRHHAPSPVGCPVIMITAHGDVPLAVEAIKAGAHDMVEKPVKAEELIKKVGAAVQLDAENYRKRRMAEDFQTRYNKLTPRQREVLEQLARGLTNKEVGVVLGISPRTVEVHRGRIMQQMMADSMVDLVRQLTSYGLAGTRH